MGDVIMCAIFGDYRLRDRSLVRGANLPYAIDLSYRSTLYKAMEYNGVAYLVSDKLIPASRLQSGSGVLVWLSKSEWCIL